MLSDTDMNNCGCNEHQFEGEMVATIMKGSVKAVTDMGWEGLKLGLPTAHITTSAKTRGFAAAWSLTSLRVPPCRQLFAV